jgi:hypothetical protein
MRTARPRRLCWVDELGHGGGDVGLAADLAAAQELEDPEDAVLAARRRQAAEQARRERHDRHPVEVGQADVGQRGPDLHRVVQLGRRADRHRVRAVDQEVDVEVLLLLEQPQEQAVEPAVQVPVDVAEVVAAGVGAVVGELDARADLAGPTFGPQVPREDLARHHVEVLDGAQEALVEQLRAVGGPAGAAGGDRRRRGGGGAGHYTVSRVDFRISAMIASALTPSASPSKLRMRRWRSAGAATARMSSIATA